MNKTMSTIDSRIIRKLETPELGGLNLKFTYHNYYCGDICVTTIYRFPYLKIIFNEIAK